MQMTSGMISLDGILTQLADELDVSPSKYREAQERYQAVGNWLGRDESAFAGRDVRIYPQGSFAIGTATRPIGDGDYDVDAVLSCDLKKSEISQQELKAAVGHRLRQHPKYRDMIEPPDGGRRCWTLRYADASKFHLDILPAIPDDPQWLIEQGIPFEMARHAICITDREAWVRGQDWPKSNPAGFARWFRLRMHTVFERQRLALAEARRAQIDQVPEYEVRTPLQRVIQLLKRHRDMRFSDDSDKPASIIITTLAADSYSNENTVSQTLQNILPKMRPAIQERAGVYWIPNPVNPLENFADRWKDNPRQGALFFEWISSLEDFQRELAAAKGLSRIGDKLANAYGQRETNVVFEQLGETVRRDRETDRLFVGLETGTLNTRESGTRVRRHTFFGS